jgi:hypothetical protein
MDPFSDESLHKFEEWRRTNSTKSRLDKTGSVWGYVYRGAALGLLYGSASLAGYPGVPEAIVIVAILAYYCGRVAARSTRS